MGKEAKEFKEAKSSKSSKGSKGSKKSKGRSRGGSSVAGMVGRGGSKTVYARTKNSKSADPRICVRHSEPKSIRFAKLRPNFRLWRNIGLRGRAQYVYARTKKSKNSKKRRVQRGQRSRRGRSRGGSSVDGMLGSDGSKTVYARSKNSKKSKSSKNSSSSGMTDGIVRPAVRLVARR